MNDVFFSSVCFFFDFHSNCRFVAVVVVVISYNRKKCKRMNEKKTGKETLTLTHKAITIILH